MQRKIKGIAEIEIENIENGYIEKYTEYNKLTPFLSELFDKTIFDGCVKYNRELKNYASKLVLSNGDFNEYSTLIPDSCELLDVIQETSIDDYIDDEFEGIEYTFELGTDVIGTFNNVSLAPSSFVNFKKVPIDFSNELVRGYTDYQVLGTTDTANYGSVIKLDIKNSMYYALQFDKNYLYINQIEHDFNAIQLFQINNASSSKLISSTAIDLTDFRANSPDAFLSYAVDHINNNLIIFYTYSETQQHINTFVIDLDDLTITETHKMTVPNELFLDLSAEEYAAFSIYKGKLIFSCTYTADNISTYEIVGIDYLDSTNYIIYESNLDYNLQMQRNAAILFNDNDTLISSNLILKNDHAYIVNNNSISSLYFYDSSKIININNNNMVEVLLSPLSVATINKLSKTIIKTAAEKIKIKYRIVRERV